jgi:hypothetical protein
MKFAAASFAFTVALLMLVPRASAVDSVEGKVVEVGTGKITLLEKEGKNQFTHEVAADAAISCDGKDCRLDDITKDCWATITTEKRGEKTVVIKIVAKKSKEN